jgi:hypothetical protein
LRRSFSGGPSSRICPFYLQPGAGRGMVRTAAT